MERKNTRNYKEAGVSLPRRYFSTERVVAGLVAMMFLVGVSFFGLRWIESAITFHPVPYVTGARWTIPPGAQDVWVPTRDGLTLHGWFFPSRAELPTVIYFHGNGGNITNVGWVGEDLAARGFNVLLFDYRGYGRSQGKVGDEQNLYLDADAAYDFVTRTTAPERVVLYGQSLGTTAVADLASRRPCGALILESGLSSASNMAETVLPWFPRSMHFLLRNKFDSARKLHHVKSPVLITHGDPDPVIPTLQARELFAAANDPKKLVLFPGAGHNVFGTVGDPYLDLVAKFIRDSMIGSNP